MFAIMNLETSQWQDRRVRFMSSLRKILSVSLVLSLILACNAGASLGNADAPPGCYQVTFLNSTENPDDSSTWSYKVEELACAQDLSNWMLELADCATVQDAAPSPWEIVQPDPNYHFNGIKWQTGTDFQSREFSIVLSGALTTGMVRYGVKGPDVSIGLVEGPVCQLQTFTPDGSETPSSTPAVDITASPEKPLPTLPVATVQPPASAGFILITDNDQTLTFTCNGNAVEVRGNANVITLLGACSSITVKGNGNQVYWQSGSPVITDTGNENSISQR
jgi:hypothetical protein